MFSPCLSRTARTTAVTRNALAQRWYSESAKRSTATAQQQQQQQQARALSKSATSVSARKSNQNKVPKFDIPRAEFMVADLFSQHRQMVGSSMAESRMGEGRLIGNASNNKANSINIPRASFKTLSELNLMVDPALTGATEAEPAGIPRARLQQIYTAPASVHMRITPDSMVPESMRLGPLAEPLFGVDTFRDGFSSLRMGDGEQMHEFVEEMFDTIMENAKAPAEMTSSVVEKADYPMEGVSDLVEDGELPEGFAREYQMTSVLRKRKTKMNKHKLKKLRKRTKSLRKRFGK